MTCDLSNLWSPNPPSLCSEDGHNFALFSCNAFKVLVSIRKCWGTSHVNSQTWACKTELFSIYKANCMDLAETVYQDNMQHFLFPNRQLWSNYVKRFVLVLKIFWGQNPMVGRHISLRNLGWYVCSHEDQVFWMWWSSLCSLWVEGWVESLRTALCSSVPPPPHLQSLSCRL